MAPLDWGFAAVLVLSLLVGIWRGLVYEVLSLASWVAAFVLAQWFAPHLALHLPMAGAAEVVRYAAAFVLVFIAAVFAMSLVTWLVSRLFQAAGLRPADRVLGGVFGLMRGVAIVLAVAVVVSMTPMKNEAWWTGSIGAAWAMATVKGLKPVLPQELVRYLP